MILRYDPLRSVEGRRSASTDANAVGPCTSAFARSGRSDAGRDVFSALHQQPCTLGTRDVVCRSSTCDGNWL
jgi:hypothetical protein